MGDFFGCLLLCVFDAFRFPNQIYLDLTGIFHFFLDLLCKVMSQNNHLILADLLGLHHDPHLAAGLNGIRFLNALERGRNALQLLQPLDVVLQILAAGTGTGCGNGIRRLNEARDDGPGRNRHGPW